MSFIEIYETRKLLSDAFQELVFLKLRLSIINERMINLEIYNSTNQSIINLSNKYKIPIINAKLIIYETLVEYNEALKKQNEIKQLTIQVLDSLKQLSFIDYITMYQLVENYIK